MGFIFISIIILFANFNTYSYSVSALTGMSGAKTLTINPVFYDIYKKERSVDLMLGYGFTDIFEIYAVFANLSFFNPVEYHGSFILGRIALNESNILGLQIQNNAEDWLIITNYSFFKELHRSAIELNANVGFNTTRFKSGSVGIIIAPVFKLVKEIVYPFIEIDPTFSFDGDVDLKVAPGIWFGIPRTTHQFSISLPIGQDDENKVRPTLNAWWSWSVSFSKLKDK
jgi:hypothetical protein